MTWPPRYLDYPVEPPPDPGTEDKTSSASFEDHTVIVPIGDHWHAIWAGEFEPLGEFDGGRDEAIAWAKTCSDRCYLYDRSIGDVTFIESWAIHDAESD